MKVNLKSRKRRGFAVMVVLLVLALLTALSLANARALFYLKRDLQLIESRQERKYLRTSSGTNTVPVAPPGLSLSRNHSEETTDKRRWTQIRMVLP